MSDLKSDLTKAVLTATGSETLNVIPSTSKPETSKQESGKVIIQKEIIPEEIDYKAKPIKKSDLSGKNLILEPYVRLPLIERKTHTINTFEPNPTRAFQVLNIMDELVYENVYFNDMEYKWHPFLSRMYLSALWLYQTCRAQKSAGILPIKYHVQFKALEESIPAESLPVPGPLAPFIKAIAAATPSSSRFERVVPVIPKDTGINTPTDLITEAEDYASMMIYPHGPALAYFTNMLAAADIDNIPDFTRPDTFDDSQDRNYYGVLLQEDNWNQKTRNMLLNPVLRYPVFTNPDIDVEFNRAAIDLSLPLLAANSPVSETFDYSLLTDSTIWVKNVAKIMSHYSSFFRGSTTLSSCSPSGPTCSLVTSSFTRSSTPAIDENPVFTLNEAFTGKEPFADSIKYKSYEYSIVQPYDSMAQLSIINSITHVPNLDIWSGIVIPRKKIN